MSVVSGAAIIPTAPVLLPEVSPDQPAEDRETVEVVREEVADTFNRLPHADVVVLLAAGPRGVHRRAVSSLRPLGITVDDLELAVDETLVPHTTRLTQYPLALGGSLPVTHAVMVRLVAQHLGRVPVLPVSVDPNTDGDVLVNIGASLVEALRDAHRTAIVIAAGELSACLTEKSPGYLVDGAHETDQELVDAVAQRDIEALAGLGPEEAARVRADGWAPIAVLGGVVAAGRLSLDSPPVYDLLRGVGRIHARYAPAGGEDVGGRFRTGGTAPLKLPRDAEPT